MEYADKKSFTKSNVCGNPMPNTFAPQKSTFWAATSSHYRVVLSDLEESSLIITCYLVSKSFPAKLKYKTILCLTFFVNHVNKWNRKSAIIAGGGPSSLVKHY